MTDDKPYRSVIAAGRSPFQPARAELVAELEVLIRYRPEGLGDLNLPMQDAERWQIEEAMKARACELLRALYPFRPTAADWAREDAVLGHDFNGRPVYVGARVGVHIREWVPAKVVSFEHGRFVVLVDVEGCEASDTVLPQNLLVDHPCTKAPVHEPPPLNERVEVCILGSWNGGTLLAEEPDGWLLVRPDGWKTASKYDPLTVRRAPVHEPPPTAEDESWICVECGYAETSKLTRCAHCGRERYGHPPGAIERAWRNRGSTPNAEQEDDEHVREASIFADDKVRHARLLKLRELARDLLDALHDPGPDDGACLVRLQRTARPLAEFILGERDA
jgi:hypothetical protein